MFGLCRFSQISADGQGSAPWCADLLAQTNSSFLREALGGERRVLSKPGYEIDTPWYRTPTT